MGKRSTNPDFLTGVPELLTLQLIGRKPMYGYQIAQEIKLLSDQALSVSEGSIYPVLHRLERSKLIQGSRETVNGRERTVYRLTKAGRKQAQASRCRWQDFTAAVNRILEGGGHERAPSH